MSFDADRARQGLRELANDSAVRSKIAVFREVFGEVQAALAAGVSQQRVRMALEQYGLVLSEGAFKTMLARLRKQCDSSAAPTLPKRSPSSAPASAAPAQFLPTLTAPEQQPKLQPGTTPNDRSPAASPDPQPATLEEVLASKPDVDALERQYRRMRRAKLEPPKNVAPKSARPTSKR